MAQILVGCEDRCKLNQQKVDSGTRLGVSFAMPSETEVMRQLAVYYAVGIVVAAVAFRIIRAWLKGRQRSRDRSL